MDNKFLPKATEFVNQAVLFDRTGEYEKALEFYQKALEYFITGLKYEQNPSSKRIIQEKVAGYMDRAEQIKKSLLDSQGSGPPAGSSSTKTMSREDKNKEKEDDEKSKLRGALSSAVVSEKPNVRWDDVAGLEGAKEALKEGNRHFCFILYLTNHDISTHPYSCHSPKSIPTVIYGKTQALEGYSAVWSARYR